MQTMLQQQSVVPAPPAAIFDNSPTPMVPGFGFQALRGDFKMMLGGRKRAVYSAQVLRGIETMTTARRDRLQEHYSIPRDTLPDERDLWITASHRGLSEWIDDTVGYSKAGKCLAELVRRGYLRLRFVVWLNDDEPEPPTTIYLDPLRRARYIILADQHGNFDGEAGQGNIADEEYLLKGEIEWQYLYQIDVVNADLARLAFRDPPPSPLRWPPLTRQRRPSAPTDLPPEQEGSSVSEPKSTKTTNSEDATSTESYLQTSAAKQTTDRGDPCSSQYNAESRYTSMKSESNIPDDSDLAAPLSKQAQTQQLHRNTIQIDEVAALPWNSETIIALSALVLDGVHAIPARDAIDEDRWLEEYEEPAKKIAERLASDDPLWSPRSAWETLCRHVTFMVDPASGSWHATQRAVNSPITLRLVEKNWKSIEAQLGKASWNPPILIEYYGPEPAASSSADPAPGLDYSAGYGGLVELSPSQLAPSIDDDQADFVEVIAGDALDHLVDALPAGPSPISPPDLGVAPPTVRASRVPGMLLAYAERLAEQIQAEQPTLQLGVFEVGPRRYAVGIEYAPDSWLQLCSRRDYEEQTQETQQRIAQALAFADWLSGGTGDDESPGGLDDDDEGGGGSDPPGGAA